MPIYEYDCPSCGGFEVLQRMSDPPLVDHACGSRVKKLMSAGAFAIRGSDFHATGTNAPPACEAPKGEGCGSCPSNRAA